MSAPSISVIVPARDAGRTLPRTLACLRAQELNEPFETIVVDDGSSDPTCEIAEAAEGVKLLRQDAQGPAQARNLGAANARGDALVFLDADCYPAPGWLAAGLEALRHADLIQGHVRPVPERTPGPFDRTLWVTFEVGLYETANLFVTREAFDGAGGFEEWLRPAIGKAIAEDVWFGWKARRNGARSAFCEDALVHHEIFERGPAGYVAERRRLRYFPPLAAKIPELRSHLFFGRVFLNRRSAAFDAAVAGSALAVAQRSPVPLVAAAPYVRLSWRRARSHARGRAPLVAAVDLAADAVGLWSLLLGSARARSLLL